MTKSKKDAAASVSVELLCIYSGDGESWSVGAVIEVDADEAERLISLGAAKPVEVVIADAHSEGAAEE